MEKTHWKNFHDYKYLGAYSIDGEDLTLTIRSTKEEMVKGQSGREEPCFVCYFEEQEKGMILNKTNAKMIQTVHGTPYVEEWVGKQIVLGTEKVSAFGETADALRIRAYKPKVQIDPTEAIARIESCLDMDELKKTFKSLTATEQTNNQIINAKNKMKNEFS